MRFINRFLKKKNNNSFSGTFDKTNEGTRVIFSLDDKEHNMLLEAESLLINCDNNNIQISFVRKEELLKEKDKHLKDNKNNINVIKSLKDEIERLKKELSEVVLYD